jgi:hypothetical protein
MLTYLDRGEVVAPTFVPGLVTDQGKLWEEVLKPRTLGRDLIEVPCQCLTKSRSVRIGREKALDFDGWGLRLPRYA